MLKKKKIKISFFNFNFFSIENLNIVFALSQTNENLVLKMFLEKDSHLDFDRVEEIYLNKILDQLNDWVKSLSK